MTFKERWEDLFGQLLDKLDRPDNTPRPAPADIIGALPEIWMAEGLTTYANRFDALMNAAGLSRAGILMTEQGLPLVIISADAATTSSHGPLGELIGVDLADALLSLHATMDQCEHEPELMSDYLTNKETVNHLVSGLEAVYALWNACDPARREDLKDPLAALIESWLSDQPVPADTRKTGIMPRAIIRDTDLEGTFFDLTEDIRPETDGQARLPGFALYDDSAIALPLQLRDFTGIPRSRGRGAALADRIWVEAVMWKPVEYRFLSRPVSVYWGDFINALMPNGRYCQRDAVRIVEALHIVHNLRLPWQIGKTGGERAVVIVLDIPRHWNAYEDVVTFEINLPPGVRDRGPLVYKPTLRVLGQKSALQWRGYLNLCYQFDRYGARNGRYIQPTRPRLLRDVQDRLLRIDGTLLLDKDGKPVRTWTIKRKRSSEMIWEPRSGLVPLNDRGEPVPTLKDAAQERNPAADRYPVLSPEQQVALVYPPAPNTLRKSARSMRRSRAEDALSNMAGKGYIITEHLDRGVRILPPLGWGAGYGG